MDNNYKEKLSDCRYLVINAIDDYEMGLRRLTIDLRNNKIISGIVTLFDNGSAVESVDVLNLKDIHGWRLYRNDDKIHLFMKARDMGEYTLEDYNKAPLFKLFGYVPDLFDFINASDGFGDYIDILIDENGVIYNESINDKVSIYDKMLENSDEKMIFGENSNNWKYCSDNEDNKTETDYATGYNDGLRKAMEIISECYSEIESLIKRQ